MREEIIHQKLKIGKDLKKNNTAIAINVLYVLLSLSCCKKPISIIEKNNIKTPR